MRFCWSLKAVLLSGACVMPMGEGLQASDISQVEEESFRNATAWASLFSNPQLVQDFQVLGSETWHAQAPELFEAAGRLNEKDLTLSQEKRRRLRWNQAVRPLSVDDALFPALAREDFLKVCALMQAFFPTTGKSQGNRVRQEGDDLINGFCDFWTIAPDQIAPFQRVLWALGQASGVTDSLTKNDFQTLFLEALACGGSLSYLATFQEASTRQAMLQPQDLRPWLPALPHSALSSVDTARAQVTALKGYCKGGNLESNTGQYDWL